MSQNAATPRHDSLFRSTTEIKAAVGHYHGCLWRAVHRATRNAPQEQEDAFAVALTATWKAREAGAAEEIVYTIAYRKYLNYMRGKVPNPQHFGTSFDGNGWQVTDSLRCAWDGGMKASEACMILESLLALVTENQRRTVRLFFLEGCTASEVAAMRGCHPSAVYAQVERAIKTIRAALGQDALEKGVRCSDGKLPLPRNYNPQSDERRAAMSITIKNVLQAKQQAGLPDGCKPLS